MSKQPPQTRDRRRARRRLGVRSRRQRRGVLMLVVLSVLILFLLIGTTFLVASSAYQTASKVVDKANRTTFQPEDVLERALMQLLRDTNNQHSVARYHSLLRDLYGTDGFVARVDLSGNTLSGAPRYAGADPAVAGDLGPTRGQIVELYVSDFAGGTPNVLDDANAVGLDFDEEGLPYEHALNKTDAYYEGCLLTMLDGPCRGDSVRVVDYDYLGDSNNRSYGRLRVMAPARIDGRPLAFSAGNGVLTDFVRSATVGHRFMVNGRPFNGVGVGYNAYASPGAARLTALELIDLNPDPAVTEAYGLERALIPNPVEYFELANTFLSPSAGVDPWARFYSGEEMPPLTRGFVGSGLNGAPNPAYDSATSPLYKGFVGPGDADESYDAADFQNMFLALQGLAPRERGRVLTGPVASPTAVDPAEYYASGDNQAAPRGLDLEGLTIPSFHRPSLVHFWFNRLLNSQWLTNQIGDSNQRALAILAPYEVLGYNSVVAQQIVAIKRKFMLRPLHEDHPDFNGSNPHSRYATGVYTPQAAGELTITDQPAGQFELTFPSWEVVGPWDVDNDNDGVPDSVWVDLGLPIQRTEDGRYYKPLVAMLVEDLGGRLNLNAHGSSEHFVSADLDASNLASALGGRNLAQDYNQAPYLHSSNQLPHGAGWGTADISLRPILSPDLPFALGAFTGDADFDDYARLLVGRPSPDWVDPSNPSDVARVVADQVNVEVTFGRLGSYPADQEAPSGSPFGLYRPGLTFNLAQVFAPNPPTRDPRVPFDFAGYPLTNDPTVHTGFGATPDLFSRYSTGLGPLGLGVIEPTSDARLFGARAILDDSPYEVKLSDAGRRRSVEDLATIVASYATNEPINDDAPFSPAELERLLRAYDSDAQELPDRLWNLVDAFDPAKLAVQQAILDNRINANNYNLGSFPPPPPDMDAEEAAFRMANAQTQASINRRQATTESFDLPVPNENWTSRLVLGADGLPGVPQFNDDSDQVPGVPGVDDNNNGQVDEAAELVPSIDEGDEAVVLYDPNEQHTLITDGVTSTVPYQTLWENGCDDYPVVMLSNPPTNARITDYLRYRIVLELARKGAITLYPAGNRTNPQVIDQLVNQIIFGDDAALAGEVRDDLPVMPYRQPTNLPADLYTFGGMLAPEVLAGRKMDLNRPFGDGRDNNNNGVVDEPAEAGEPWIDRNNDGVWQAGEAYQDLDGDGVFDPPLNAYDTNNNGVVDAGEQYNFDYTMGRDANGRGAYAAGGRVRDDALMARQLYARHLYCLMLAVMDENYLAPYDPNDPQVIHYLDPLSGSLTGTAPSADASMAFRIALALFGADPTQSQAQPADEQRRRLALRNARAMAMRKLTCRQIAQWAINCVDIRDPDSIQTPFEYDENPWDGWNVISYSGAQPSVFPLDGDLTTDENFAMFRDLSGGVFTAPTAPLQGVAENDRTRGVVWGAERPELLLNEGLAWHDRRTQDLALGAVIGPESDDFGQVTGSSANPEDERDYDLDQRYKPTGPCFVELFNPWSVDSPLPAELYRDPGNTLRRYDGPDGNDTVGPNDPAVEGLLLDRLSDGLGWMLDKDGSPTTQLTRSPVWRMACVEGHPLVRNATLDDSLSVEINDDPRTSFNNGEYLDLTLDNGPWAYHSDKYLELSGGADIDPMPKAYRDFARFKMNQAFDIARTAPGEVFLGANRVGNEEITITNPDPDFPTFDREAQPRQVASVEVTISNPGLGDADGSGQSSVNRQVLLKPNEYLERLYYFAGAPSVAYTNEFGNQRDLVQNTGVRVPRLFYDVELPQEVLSELRSFGRSEFLNVAGPAYALADDGLQIAAKVPANGAIGERRSVLRVHVSRFTPLDEFDTDGDHNSDQHETDAPLEWTPLAPILPRHYGVVGSTGAIYGKDHRGDYDANTVFDQTYEEFAKHLSDRYTTVVSRTVAAEGEEPENEFLPGPNGARPLADEQVGFRRIELIPSTNPYRQQVVFRMNGGLESDRLSEVVNLDGAGFTVNVTDPIQFVGGNPTPAIQPVVAIPMEGFSISEPLDGYLVRQTELDPELNLKFYRDPRVVNTSDRPAEGIYTNGDGDPAGYDEPFDLLPELIENQTTPNYRAMHLQRLANPMLPWNPPPLRPNGQPSLGHDASRPVNPYLTADSLSLDLTSLNGIDSREDSLEPTPTISAVDGPEVRHQVQRSMLPDDATNRPYTKITHQSQERGLHGFLAGAVDIALPSRSLWGQDRPTGVTEILIDAGVALTANDQVFAEMAGGVLELAVGGGKDRFSFGTDEDLTGAAYREHIVDYPIRHSLGFANRALGKFYNFARATAGLPTNQIDLNGDGNLDPTNGAQVPGELIGAPEIDTVNAIGADDVPPPELHWPNRPFISEGELLLTPAWGSSRMLTYYSSYNPLNQKSYYDGSAFVQDPSPSITRDNTAELTNAERWGRTQNPFGHLLNFFQTAAEPAQLRSYTITYTDPATSDNITETKVVAWGAPHFYRLLDYVHVPSRFVETDTVLDPTVFNQTEYPPSDPRAATDPRRGLRPPFNRVDHYREPGKVNLNTVVTQRDPQERLDMWSGVYDGLMHRRHDANAINYGADPTNPVDDTLLGVGHLGPAWRDVVLSRRGYVTGNVDYTQVQAEQINYSPTVLSRHFPTLFANPLRSSEGGYNIPVASMQHAGVDATLLRAHPISPGVDGAWGLRTVLPDERTVDKSGALASTADNINHVRNDNDEAAFGVSGGRASRAADNALVRMSNNGVPRAVPDTLMTSDASSALIQILGEGFGPTPCFAGASTEPSLDTERNPHLRYGPMARLSNLAGGRSGVFAVWITVGFFEVKPATQETLGPGLWNLYFDANGQIRPNLEADFFRIYQEGYTLGKEINLDTGENRRHRGFYLIDRTRPVAFKPGDDVNVENAILLRRRIE